MTDDETWVDADHANTLNTFDAGDTRTTHAIVQQPVTEVVSTLQGGGGSPRGQRNDAEGAAGGHLIPQTFSVYPEGGNGADIAATEVDRSPSLTKVQSERGIHVAFNTEFSNQAAPSTDVMHTLDKNANAGVASQMSVRRLTPIECERLMGWPDNHTAPPGIKAPDSKRYAACGDGIVSHVSYWIGCRIQMIEAEDNA
jgi:site-specific DNA-cytosine methylase